MRHFVVLIWPFELRNQHQMALRKDLPFKAKQGRDGARSRVRTWDPYRVKVMLYR